MAEDPDAEEHQQMGFRRVGWPEDRVEEIRVACPHPRCYGKVTMRITTIYGSEVTITCEVLDHADPN